jgi:hypothetical protein
MSGGARRASWSEAPCSASSSARHGGVDTPTIISSLRYFQIDLDSLSPGYVFEWVDARVLLSFQMWMVDFCPCGSSYMTTCLLHRAVSARALERITIVLENELESTDGQGM